MPITLPQEFITEAEKPHQSEPWIWCWEIVVDDPVPPATPTWIRVTSNPEIVTMPLPGSGASPAVFYPFPMTHSPIENSGEGNLPRLDISLDNTGRTLSTYLETGDIEGNRATLWLLNRKTFGSSVPAYIQWDFEIAGVTMGRDAVAIRCEMPPFFERRVPTERYNAQRCRWLEFGGPECGYVINSAAAYTTCDRTLEACADRGADEASRKIPVLHPYRFGGFPGIPIQQLR